MNAIYIENLPENRELDRRALQAITGGGWWGSVKKYSSKAVGWVGDKIEDEVTLRYNAAKDLYHTPGTIYSIFRGYF